jgi:hypothetical protein
VEVDVIDNAPRDARAALEVAMNAAKAMDVTISPLRCVRDRTYHLPVATYPDALKEAARLLDQKKNDEASYVLLTALNTLVAIDKVTPIPLLLARTALNGARLKARKTKQPRKNCWKLPKPKFCEPSNWAMQVKTRSMSRSTTMSLIWRDS